MKKILKKIYHLSVPTFKEGGSGPPDVTKSQLWPNLFEGPPYSSIIAQCWTHLQPFITVLHKSPVTHLSNFAQPPAPSSVL